MRTKKRLKNGFCQIQCDEKSLWLNFFSEHDKSYAELILNE